jgi:endo-1,4-beta-mannosidase
LRYIFWEFIDKINYYFLCTLNSFIKNLEGRFSHNGKPFRFIGANVYELANVSPGIAHKIIDDSARMGFRVLRFWLFKNRETAELVQKLTEICDLVKPYGIKLIVSLSDKWGYLQNYKIDDEWYTSGYKNEYLRYVKDISGELRARDEIMLWELINEPESGSFQAFYDFVKHVSGEIRRVNQNHLLSVGTVGGVGDKFGNYFSVFKKSNFRNLYSLPSLDAVSIHDYSYDSGIFERLDMLHRFKGNEKKAKLYGRISDAVNLPFDKIDSYYLKKNKFVHIPFTLRGLWNIYNKSDIKFAAEIKKPVYVGEVGFKAGSIRERKRILELDIEEKFSMGVDGYILWSFQAQGWNKDGHGYGFGIDDGFGDVIKKWNKKLSDENNNNKTV